MLNPGLDRAPLGRARRMAVLFTAAALAMAVAGGNAAQSFATFAGSVVDSQNAVLPGVKFTLTQLQRLYETVLERPLDKRNFRKRILSMSLLEELDEVQQGVAHRKARLYRFDKQKYHQLEKSGFNFEI